MKGVRMEVAERFARVWAALKEQIGRLIVGHEEVIEQVLVCMFAGGHGLLEGVPGIGKTLLVRTLARCLGLQFSRIQFTPDLMPADITGTNIVVEEGGGKRFLFQKGPVFGNIVLADEINRATPKTQSALLEAMQEGAVTVMGNRYELPRPFFVLATQNPIEMEGTYPLPEAQVDRFMFKIDVGLPGVEEMVEIIGRTTAEKDVEVEQVAGCDEVLEMMRDVRRVEVAVEVSRYAARLVAATRPDAAEAPEKVRRFVRYGASPRGAQALILGAKVRALAAGRFNVAFDDVKSVAHPALRHRIILNFEGQAEEVSTDSLIDDVLETVKTVPPEVQDMVKE